MRGFNRLDSVQPPGHKTYLSLNYSLYIQASSNIRTELDQTPPPFIFEKITPPPPYLLSLHGK